MADTDDKKPPVRTWGASETWGKLGDEWPTPDELNPQGAPPSETNEVNRGK